MKTVKMGVAALTIALFAMSCGNDAATETTTTDTMTTPPMDAGSGGIVDTSIVTGGMDTTGMSVETSPATPPDNTGGGIQGGSGSER